MKPVDVEAATRLLRGAAMTAAPWLASSDAPRKHLSRAIDTYRELASGFLRTRAPDRG